MKTRTVLSGAVLGAAVLGFVFGGSSTATAQTIEERPATGMSTRVAADARAYAWNHQANAPVGTWYSLAGSYSFNSSGAENYARHEVTGRYTVWFPNLPDLGSTVHVTAYGDGDAYCTVASWLPPADGASGTDIDIRCFNRSGAAANSMFTVSQTHRGGGAGAYLWADTTGTPNTLYQYNSTGALNTMSSSGTGSYSVRLPGLGSRGGHVQVTGYAADGRWCKVASWAPNADAQNVNVRCFAAAGTPANTPFTLTYVENTNLLLGPATTPSAYAWITDTGTVPDYYAHDTNPNANTITQHQPVGGYKVGFPVDLSRGLVHVTAYGQQAERCKVTRWNTTEGVVVHCYQTNGTLVNTYFDAAFVG